MSATINDGWLAPPATDRRVTRRSACPEPTDPLALIIGREIRRRRVRRGLSTVAVATWCGVSRSAVTRWETGRRCPRVGHLYSLAAILNCQVCDLLPGRTNARRAE